MLREIVRIDESKCDGCGDCVPVCAEGALQVIDGKVRLISDLFCDGLGACLGHCPQGAITIEVREAEPYDERKVMETIVIGGANVIRAHLLHLKEHGETEYLNLALDYLNQHGIPNPLNDHKEVKQKEFCGCPGSQTMSFEPKKSATGDKGYQNSISHLRQWPIQLHLVPPRAPYYQGAHLLLTADCVPFAYSNFHHNVLQGHSLAIACPKLDSNKEMYVEKLKSMIDGSMIRSITVAIMQVPCCSGLYHLADEAIRLAQRDIPLNVVVFGIDGSVMEDSRSPSQRAQITLTS